MEKQTWREQGRENLYDSPFMEGPRSSSSSYSSSSSTCSSIANNLKNLFHGSSSSSSSSSSSNGVVSDLTEVIDLTPLPRLGLVPDPPMISRRPHRNIAGSSLPIHRNVHTPNAVTSVRASAAVVDVVEDGGDMVCMAVYASEIPAFKTPNVEFFCDHCRLSLREDQDSQTSNASKDLLIGIHIAQSAAERANTLFRPLQDWVNVCQKWYHPLCVKEVNKERTARREKPIEYGSMKYTELLSFSERMKLSRMLITP